MVSVYLNGTIVPAADAKVSAFDAALQHGVGLFETMLAVRGAEGQTRVLHMHEHLSRLRGSALGLGLAQTLHLGPLGEAVQRTVGHAAAQSPHQKRWRVRLTLTGGDLNLLARTGGAHHPSLLIVAQPATEYPAALFERGALVLLADLRVSPLDPLQGHKTPAYWGRLRELQAAAAKKADESLVFSITNHLCGGCVSNAFVVKDGVLMTPIARGEEEEVAAGDDGPTDAPLPRGPAGAVLPSPVLPGVVRRWVLDWALSEGLACRRRMLTLDDLLGADEVILTNSSWGVLPVTGLEAHRVGEGVGPVARSLVEAWGELAS
jgi:branched-chain amino acid aminotransferase